MADSKGYYEYPEAYPGPFKEVPDLFELEGESGMLAAKTGLLSDHNDSPGFEEWEYEHEGEGAKYPAARGKKD